MKKKTNREKQIKIFLLIILGYDKDFTIESRDEIKNKRDTSRVEKTKIWKNLSFTYYSWLRWKTDSTRETRDEIKSRRKHMEKSVIYFTFYYWLCNDIVWWALHQSESDELMKFETSEIIMYNKNWSRSKLLFHIDWLGFFNQISFH